MHSFLNSFLIFLFLIIIPFLLSSECPAEGCEDESNPKNAFMNMWTTPILIIHPKLNNLELFNNKLAEMIENCFQSFQNMSTEELEVTGDSAAGINEQFFQWQKEQNFLNVESKNNLASPAYSTLINSLEIRAFMDFVQLYTDHFLERIGQPKIQKRDSLFFWSAVSYNGIAHLPHTHPHAMVSGVYYIKTPPGSGSLVFEDPRGGPRYPFDGRYIHHPKAGQLVLFPSWLVHQVTATTSKDKRIALSFNILGEWETTTSVSMIDRF